MKNTDAIRVAEYRKALSRYAKPSVTADIIALRPAYEEPTETQWRENPTFSLEVLFIKRGQWPYEGCWALPGGFIRQTESVLDGAKRELKEETALTARTLLPIGVFSKPGRDMRAWIISNAFVSIHRRGEGTNVHGGDDAAEAKWLRVAALALENGRFSLPFYEGGKKVFTLQGTYQREEFGGGTILSTRENPLAFDHAEIIAQAFLRLVSFDVKQLVFFFLPEKFTLSEYLDVYQYLTHTTLELGNIPNMRRQLTQTKEPLLVACEGEFENHPGRGHAAGKLYRRNQT